MKELKGQTACPGRVKGRAKIINLPADMEKMKDGEILVSFATNPNLMPAIRKAGAIITDEGGLTSHLSGPGPETCPYPPRPSRPVGQARAPSTR